jgi:hypothetical protein
MLLRFGNCESIQQLRGTSFDYRSTLKWIKLYTEYYDHKSLERLLERYAERYEGEQIPEPFIWIAFLGLPEALYMLNTNTCTRQLVREGGDQPFEAVVHGNRAKTMISGNMRNSTAQIAFYPHIHNDIKLESK